MFGPLTPMVDQLKKPLGKLKKPLLVRHYGKTVQKAGAAPGTIVHVGERKEQSAELYVIDYDEHKLSERVVSVKDCAPFTKSKSVTWLNITGLHDTKLIEDIGERFNLHPLLLEDIVNTNQIPKFEDFEDYIFLVTKMLMYDEQKRQVIVEQVSFVIGKNFVLSFQEAKGDVFEPVRQRIRTSKGRFRKLGPDYLAYTLLDAIVDNYFVILENIGESIEDLEELLALESRPEYLPLLHGMKREMIFLRKSVWPLREVISSLQRADSKLVKQETYLYLRDVYDHTIQVIDTIETFRDMLSGMLDLYLTGLSNKMNEVMKVLTIFAAIFIPLTFIVGVYGMNFKYMPELAWKYGYFSVLGFMAVISVGMLLFFKRKHWL